MARRSVSRLEVSGYRFLLRRMEYALVSRDTRMLDDPIRGQSLALAAGVAVTAVVVAVCAVLALLRPHGTLGDDPIVLVRETAAVYVRVGDTLHPTPNLASARLIAGTPAQPRVIAAAMLTGARLGPMMGIAGAPGTVDPVADSSSAAWTVCDDAAEHDTTLFIGPRGARTDGRAVLAAARGSGRTFLLHDGGRAAIDLRDRAVVTAMRLEGIVPLSVSQSVLDALPERRPVRIPVPVTDPVGADFGGVLCASWLWTGIGQAPDTAVFTGTALPDGPAAIRLVQADGAGPQLDAVSMTGGRSVYVRAAGVAGDGQTTGPCHLVTASGAAFGVADDAAAGALGLPAPGTAPWPVLALLPRGPELAVDRATLLRDTVAAG
ncbi:type VII secretion protein EccB [Mycolicibacterium bacteremicum]|uniref:Type VII secretion protein EccB n=1 Tax=Mycolicibacterium bacteremicum TaxID=564198 RepID=A0A1W9Z378_MYCBA|nr:type VII secretion protein EccB [Mycolicibacterium bacteremicum]MCV7431730.1 type VII secretion protein EccB [Mycolicibacterium bacteremicum]ORA06796.1 type VII secretion protein EccB [Mycolicibacterium bacteremicum]